jgi:hypothetical protein
VSGGRTAERVEARGAVAVQAVRIDEFTGGARRTQLREAGRSRPIGARPRCGGGCCASGRLLPGAIGPLVPGTVSSLLASASPLRAVASDPLRASAVALRTEQPARADIAVEQAAPGLVDGRRVLEVLLEHGLYIRRVVRIEYVARHDFRSGYVREMRPRESYARPSLIQSCKIRDPGGRLNAAAVPRR